MRSVSVETKKNFKKSMQFKTFEYEGITVFIHKGLKIKSDAYIYQKRKLPFLPPSFDVRGIS